MSTARASPVITGSPRPSGRFTPSTGRPRSLLQRVLSGSLDRERQICGDGAEGSSSPARRPLQPLAPPPIELAASFGADSASEDDLPPMMNKRQRLGSRLSGVFSPLARSLSAAKSRSPTPVQPDGSGCTTFRPPPIRTMISLEGPELDISAVPSAPPSAMGHDGLPPPTPCSHAPRASFRASRLGVPAMSLIAPGLYVGDETPAHSESKLRMGGITAVLNCTNKPNPTLEGPASDYHHCGAASSESSESREGGESGGGTAAAGSGTSPIRYLRLNLLDSTSDLPRMQSVLREGVDFIKDVIKDGGCVLIHCHRGISRSCTLAMAYLIEAEQRSAESVFETLRAKRRIADPNLGYWCAIQEWEKHVLPPRLLKSRSLSSLSRSYSPHPALGPSPSPRPLSRAG